MHALVRPRGAFVVWILSACMVACGGGDTAPNTSPAKPTLVLTTLVVTLPAASLQVGQTEAASAAGLDAENRSTIATGAITWTSSNSAVASVTATGTIAALSPGQTQIVASSGGTTGQAPLTVVGAGTLTSLTLSTAGQSTAFLNAPDPSVALSVQPNAQYLIAVVNTGPSAALREDFTLALTAAGGGAASDTHASATGDVSATAPASAAPMLSTALLPRLPDVSAHLGMLEENRRVFATFGSARTRWARAAAAEVGARTDATPASTPVVPTAGTVNKVYVRNSLRGSCTAVDSIGARTVAVGQHVIVLADTDITTVAAASARFVVLRDVRRRVRRSRIRTSWPISATRWRATPRSRRGQDHRGHHARAEQLSRQGGSVVAFVNGCDFFRSRRAGSRRLATRPRCSTRGPPVECGYTSPTGRTRSGRRRPTNPSTSSRTPTASSTTARSSNIFGWRKAWRKSLPRSGNATSIRRPGRGTRRSCRPWDVSCPLGPHFSLRCSRDKKPSRPGCQPSPLLLQPTSRGRSVPDVRRTGASTLTPITAPGERSQRWATDQYAAPDGQATFIKSLINEPTAQRTWRTSACTRGSRSPTLLMYWNLATGIFQTPEYARVGHSRDDAELQLRRHLSRWADGLTCGGVHCGFFTPSGSPCTRSRQFRSRARRAQTITGVPGTSAVFFLLSA